MSQKMNFSTGPCAPSIIVRFEYVVALLLQNFDKRSDLKKIIITFNALAFKLNLHSSSYIAKDDGCSAQAVQIVAILLEILLEFTAKKEKQLH